MIPPPTRLRPGLSVRRALCVSHICLLLGRLRQLTYHGQWNHPVATVIGLGVGSLSSGFLTASGIQTDFHYSLATGRDCPVEADNVGPSGCCHLVDFQDPGTPIETFEIVDIGAIFVHDSEIEFLVGDLGLGSSLSGGLRSDCGLSDLCGW